jgi:predicted O-linked N-acetylglucosamine transferase (SPINDLY family)
MTWARILRQLPRAQLYLGNVRCIPRDIGDRAISLFAHFGVADRVQFHEPPPGQDVSADFFARVDVFLDAHPVSHFFDVCKALWMGVPAITRKGGRRSALMGASVLHAAGKPEWIAESDEAYIERAVTLGSLPYALAAVRRDLRGEVEGSPLCDTQRFVRAMEKVYRQAWDETVDAQK